MSFKSYKLIPIEEYEKIKSCEPVYSDIMEEEDQKPKDATVKRSIHNIIDENLEQTEFKPGTHFVADYKLFPQKGSGDRVPLFLPNSTELPQFSRAMKLEKSYNELSTVLNDDTLSDDLKIKLYNILKRKYDMHRKVDHSIVDGDKKINEKIQYKDGEIDRGINLSIDRISNQEKKNYLEKLLKF